MTAAAAAPPRLRVLRAVLTAVAAVFYALGWVLGMAWVPVAWVVTALVLGWRDATGKAR